MAHILVVEDDKSISDWICDYLNSHGFEVSVADRGDIAVDLIAEDKPDLAWIARPYPALSSVGSPRYVKFDR